MKRIGLTIAALALTGTMTYGQVTQVVSRNAVGYVKIAITNGGFNLATVPFNDVGDTTPRTITEVLGNQLTGTPGVSAGSDFVLLYNTGAQGFDVFWKADPFSALNATPNPSWRLTTDPLNEATNTLAPGQGFFIQNNQASNQCLFVMGEVPDSFTVANDTTTVTAVEGFTLFAYTYPVDINVTNITLVPEVAAQGFGADQLILWDAAIQGYKVYFYDNIFGSLSWKRTTDPLGANTDVIRAGEGVFYNHTQASLVDWDEAKPYTWP